MVVQEVERYIAGFVPSQATTLRGKYNNGRRLYDDSGATIDVLVVWTRQAECRYTGKGTGPVCGLDQSSYDSMAGLVDLLVAQANAAYTSSGVQFTIRLVHAYRHETYVEDSTIDTSLISLRTNGDSKLDDVHAKRALYGADLVHMIIGTTGCGVAYLGPEKTKAFSVTRYTCAVSQYSFPHELAHSLVSMPKLLDWLTPYSSLKRYVIRSSAELCPFKLTNESIAGFVHIPGGPPRSRHVEHLRRDRRHIPLRLPRHRRQVSIHHGLCLHKQPVRQRSCHSRRL